MLIKSKEILLAQVGEKEVKPNDSPKIRQYLASVGINYPAPFCAAGQYFCFSESINLLHIQHCQIPIIKSGLANSIFNSAKAKNMITIYKSANNDLIVWRKSGTIFGHIERVISVGSKGWVHTVGFNTSNGNPSDGDGVYIRKRNIYHPLQRLAIRGLIGFQEPT